MASSTFVGQPGSLCRVQPQQEHQQQFNDSSTDRNLLHSRQPNDHSNNKNAYSCPVSPPHLLLLHNHLEKANRTDNSCHVGVNSRGKLYRCTTSTTGQVVPPAISSFHYATTTTTTTTDHHHSSPTSWQFRCDSRSRSVGVGIGGVPPQMMVRSPALLTLNLSTTEGGGGGSSTSGSTGTCSLSTTPSPLEEHIPGQPYHLVFSPGSNGTDIGTTPTASGPFHCASVSACACCADNNVTLLLGGAEDPLDFSEGSRTSTGSSHKSQDSGFSDSGDRKRERRSVHSQIASPHTVQPENPEIYQGRPPPYDPPPQVHQIYECVGPQTPAVPMPSPIPPAGFGCGRFPLRHPSNHITSSSSSEGQRTGPLCHPVPVSTCIDCLSCSTPLISLPARQRRSFSPSALASSCTQTALAALRVPLSCSTPKRGAGSASTSRLVNGNPLKIDNFESLNKNAGMNKDKNNNRSSAAAANGGAGKANKTFTLATAGASTLSCLSSGNWTKSGTVVGGPDGLSPQQERAPAAVQTKRSGTRTAAESIYDKICNRLSSLSTSATSSHTSSSSSSAAAAAAKTLSDSPFQSSHADHDAYHDESYNNLAAASKFRAFARSSSAKWQSLPRGIRAPRPPPPPPPSPPRSNLSTPPPAHCSHEEEEEYHEERPIDVPQSARERDPSPVSCGGAWREAMARVEETQAPPVVRLWLSDLRTQTEAECLHSLQNKWILPLEEDEEEDGGEDPRSITSASSCVSSSGKMSSSSSRCSSSMPSSSTSCYARRLRRQEERRSQQRFLSSMTAAIHAVSTPLMSIRTVEMTANVISAEFSKICKHLEFGVFTQVPTLVMSLVGHIQDMLRGGLGPCPTIIEVTSSYTLLGPALFAAGHLKKLEGRLEDACFALSMAVKGVMGEQQHGSQLVNSASTASSSISNSSSILEGEQYQQVIGDVVEGIVTVGNLFSEVVDLRLSRDLGSILDRIEAGGIPARIALKSLVTVLADGGNHICRLAADIRTVRGLLGVMLDTREDQDKMLALRCLATLLCVGEAVKDFDKAGGFEIIADILGEPVYPLSLKLEAVAVLTQATDPWIDLESTLITLGLHLPRFIVALTNLIGEFKNDEEPFLLIVAAISNLTFLEVASTEHLKGCGTVSDLIRAVRSRPFPVFVLDHVATILANMAGVESCRQEIIQCGGVDALLHFLEQTPSSHSNIESVSAVTACERLQQKSTIALSRLANEEGVARYVFEMGGVHRLISLCRREKERNYSDGVLIAALATLRKLVSICGAEAVKGLGGAEDLIQPRLLDSFLLYSSRQESYV